MPSDGNNYIIYDFQGTKADLYEAVPHHEELANTITIEDGKKSTYLIQYNLQGGNDKLEITGSLQEALKSIFITGSSGNDYLSGITIADGGDGDDEIITLVPPIETMLINVMTTPISIGVIGKQLELLEVRATIQ